MHLAQIHTELFTKFKRSYPFNICYGIDNTFYNILPNHKKVNVTVSDQKKV